MKVVINRCFGGFGLSDAAVRRYFELKGWPCHPEADKFGNYTYWKVPPDSRPAEIDWHRATQEERSAYNRACSESIVYDRDIARNDSTLVQVVEEMGADANGQFASLSVVEIPDGIEWGIREYDGIEHVEEAHRTWN